MTHPDEPPRPDPDADAAEVASGALAEPRGRQAPPSQPTEQSNHKGQRTASAILAALVGGIAVIGFLLAVEAGKGDTALLFVGLPGLLAIATVLSPARTLHGITFKVITVALLLSAIYLHEGAVCVLLAAPLVYAVGHGIAAIAQLIGAPHRRLGVFLILPLLAALSVEGLIAGVRAAPEQTVTATREVAITPAAVAERIADGPALGAPRSPLLRAVGMPLPYRASGDGLAVGSRWTFGYAGSSHGPGGAIVTEVTGRTRHSVRFDIVRDTSITARWLRWRTAEVSWRSAGEGRTEIRLTFRFVRGLDPSWYFGPMQNVFAHAGADYLLDSLTTTATPHPRRSHGGHG